MFRFIAGLLLALITLGCSTQTSLAPITGIIVKSSFQVTPPRGNYWFVDDRGLPSNVRFVKQDPAKQALLAGDPPESFNPSFIVQIKCESFSDYDLTTDSGLEDALKFAVYEDPSHYKYDQVRFERFRWQDTDCIRYTVSRQNPEIIEGTKKIFVWNVEGYFCRHPFIRKNVVIGLLQEKRLSDTPTLLDEHLRKEAEEVLKSVQFRRW